MFATIRLSRLTELRWLGGLHWPKVQRLNALVPVPRVREDSMASGECAGVPVAISKGHGVSAGLVRDESVGFTVTFHSPSGFYD
jgi:hypothetical protein